MERLFQKADYLTKKVFKSDRVSLVMLSKKRVDLVLLDKLVTEYHLKNDPAQKVKARDSSGGTPA